MLRRKNKLKKIRILLVLFSLAVILMSINVNSAIVLKQSNEDIRAFKNNNLLRFHVIANSNTTRDQYIKRKIRDNVITYMSKYERKTFIDFAEEIDDLNIYINDILKKEGLNYKADIELGRYYFPSRTYEDMTLSAGDYKALQILLGQAKGSNWWCVLLPAVCIENEEQEDDTLADKIEFRFKILKWLNQDKEVYDEEQARESQYIEMYKKLELYELFQESFRISGYLPHNLSIK